jgi:polyisoprenoid-binding protein YceI
MRWAIDLTHSRITFAVKHLGISTVRGTFDTFSGTIDETDGVISGADVTIDVASLNTGTAQRDDHLRSADFFDVATYPTATFRLLSATRTGENLTAQGELTIRGVTKPVTLTGEIGGPAKDPWGNTKVSATLSTTLPRKEWGLTWNAVLESGGVLVSEDVKLDIELQAAPLAAEVAA